MLSAKRLFWFALLASLALACSLPSVVSPTTSPSSQVDLNVTMTALALLQTQTALQQTMQAAQAGAQPTPSATAPPQVMPTPTIAAPSSSPTSPPPTATAAPSPTATVLSGGIQATATGNLFCRTGPAPYYPSIDSMKAGDQAQVIGRGPEESNYWQVRTSRGNVCWVWGRWLNIQGDTTLLPLASYPPPPPGAFSILLLRQDACGGSFYLVFSVTNKGSKPLESMQIQVKDMQTGNLYQIPPANRNFFFHCSAVTDPLDMDKETEVWVPLGAADLSSHMVQVTAKACTKDNLQGECVERTPFNVTVP